MFEPRHQWRPVRSERGTSVDEHQRLAFANLQDPRFDTQRWDLNPIDLESSPNSANSFCSAASNSSRAPMFSSPPSHDLLMSAILTAWSRLGQPVGLPITKQIV